MKNPFFDFVKSRPTHSKKSFFNSNYIVLYKKTAFRFVFGPCKVPQPENMHFHFLAFSDWACPKVQNWFWKHCFTVKKWIFHCFFQSCVEGFRVFFQARKRGVLLNSCGGPQSFDFDIAYFISNYCYPLLMPTTINCSTPILAAAHSPILHHHWCPCCSALTNSTPPLMPLF